MAPKLYAGGTLNFLLQILDNTRVEKSSNLCHSEKQVKRFAMGEINEFFSTGLGSDDTEACLSGESVEAIVHNVDVR